MTDDTERVRIAINTMRARLTILGFNLAIITFQIVNTEIVSGGIALQGFEANVHLAASASLFIGLAMSMASMVAFIVSSALDREGTCDHWILLGGDILMYLALAQTVTGFFSPYLHGLEVTAMQSAEEQKALDALRNGIAVAAGLAWFLAAYLGPIVSLLRSPYGRVATLLNAFGYVFLFLLASRLWAIARTIERPGAESGLLPWLSGFVAPLVW